MIAKNPNYYLKDKSREEKDTPHKHALFHPHWCNAFIIILIIIVGVVNRIITVVYNLAFTVYSSLRVRVTNDNW